LIEIFSHSHGKELSDKGLGEEGNGERREREEGKKYGVESISGIVGMFSV
jgi:hypothetical protein